MLTYYPRCSSIQGYTILALIVVEILSLTLKWTKVFQEGNVSHLDAEGTTIVLSQLCWGELKTHIFVYGLSVPIISAHNNFRIYSTSNFKV